MAVHPWLRRFHHIELSVFGNHIIAYDTGRNCCHRTILAVAYPLPLHDHQSLLGQLAPLPLWQQA